MLVERGPLLDELCWGAFHLQAFAETPSGPAFARPPGLRQHGAPRAEARQVLQRHAGVEGGTQHPKVSTFHGVSETSRRHLGDSSETSRSRTAPLQKAASPPAITMLRRRVTAQILQANKNANRQHFYVL